MSQFDATPRRFWWRLSGVAGATAVVVALIFLWAGPADVLARSDQVGGVISGSVALVSLAVSILSLRQVGNTAYRQVNRLGGKTWY